MRDLPDAEEVNFFSNELTEGDLKELPSSLKKITFFVNEKIVGQLRDLPVA